MGYPYPNVCLCRPLISVRQFSRLGFGTCGFWVRICVSSLKKKGYLSGRCIFRASSVVHLFVSESS